ncbi:histidine kinase dimerization/phospho-acceptor domain-containing protein [Polaromonas naphthalenivorans]|uniref:histidine kinase dimerization/phospho-acceptor domain-containing protein n=1 Tax=Polaromonas naphthalenivorans TaxID=216465 RepID=UPI0003115D28|nr:histidine kinase dimerization/phospho-acceptor domain-containing protein [Polaromonas naphthalenivorans]
MPAIRLAEPAPLAPDCPALLEEAWQELQKVRALFSMASRIGRQVAWQVDLATLALTWSEDVRALYELPAGGPPTVEETIGFFAPEYPGPIRQRFEGCIATGAGFDMALQIITGQGRRVWIRILGEAARAPGGQIGWVQGVMQNIDEHKRAEAGILTLNAELEVRVQERTVQLEALNREMQAFSYSVAHDLRSPLNTVSGFGQMLLKSHGKNLDDKGRHCLARIQEGAR